MLRPDQRHGLLQMGVERGILVFEHRCLRSTASVMRLGSGDWARELSRSDKGVDSNRLRWLRRVVQARKSSVTVYNAGIGNGWIESS